MSNSRVQNTFRNSTVGVLAHLINAAISFASRTFFIKILGIEYLGISGLFSNILIMLSLTDLGIYTVMTYSLYKPIAEGDKDKIAICIHYFQRLYNIIALIILGIGLLLIPFLPYLINGSELPQNEIVRYYIILLLNSVVSYLAISRSTLFRADQKIYIIKIISIIVSIIKHIVQIVLLVLFHNYTVFLICEVCSTFGNNIVISLLALKRYPFLKKANDNVIETRFYKSQILKNLKASFVYRIGSSVLNSTDNILISLIISTEMVGYFSIYVTIYSLVNTFVMIIIDSVLASLGNFIAIESDESKYSLFKTIMLVMYIIASFCVSCYIAGMNDFIGIWIGKKYIIGRGFIFALALNRFVYCTIHPLWMMRESSGIFVETKYIMVFAAITNMILSIILGYILGISGIIIATAISYLATVYWYEPIKMSKKIFHNSVIDYWKYIAKLLIACIFPIIVSIALHYYETMNIILVIVKFILCGLVTFGSFYLFFNKTKEFYEIRRKARILLHRRDNTSRKVY